MPRVVIAAPGSGHGKTSVATGLLGALRQRGLAVSPHKVGPDYIDPGYHALAAGRPGRNLDPWLVGEDRIVPMFLHGAGTPVPADIAVIEGVMGLFDGASGRRRLRVHRARRAAAGRAGRARRRRGRGRLVGRRAAARLRDLRPAGPAGRRDLQQGRCGAPRAAAAGRGRGGGRPGPGGDPRRGQLAVPSRHLGLIPAGELGGDAAAAVGALAAIVAAGVDLDAVVRLARTAGALPYPLILMPNARPAAPPPRIAVAAGAAFTFGYAEHPELLAAAGAEVVTFDPLRDEHLPDDVHGLVIGGGFPEEHAAGLSANACCGTRSRRSPGRAPRWSPSAPGCCTWPGRSTGTRCAGCWTSTRDDRPAHARLPRRGRGHRLAARPGRDPRPRPRVPSHRHPVGRPDRERVAVDGVGRRSPRASSAAAYTRPTCTRTGPACRARPLASPPPPTPTRSRTCVAEGTQDAPFCQNLII